VSDIEEKVKNIPNEFLVVGAIYKHPELLVEYSIYLKSKYDFSDLACKFFYDNAEIIFQKRTQDFTQSNINLYMAEDKDRLATYKEYGGWNTIEKWMEMASVDDFKNYFDTLKKFSMLREFHREGFNVLKIINHSKFNLFTAEEIHKIIKSKVDRIRTVIMKDSDIHILNENMTNMIIGCLENPDMGLPLPYSLMSDMIRGVRLRQAMCVGMLSNAGKSRFMFTIIAYIALVLKQKVMVLLNEMSISEMRYCLLTTILNNSYFFDLTGISMNKKEKEITLGLYNNKDGNLIYREKDDNGNSIEAIEEFEKRLILESDEYVKVKRVAEWIEKETEGLIYAKDVSMSYDDKSLNFEINKAHMINSIDYFFYDTLKNDTGSLGEWASLIATTTKLKELANQLNVFVYSSIQLTPEAVVIQPLELNSMNIAASKGLKNVLDILFLCKEINKKDYHKYYYMDPNDTNGDWGEPSQKVLDLEKRYYCFVTDKLRSGSKKNLLFSVDLNLNRWIEEGELFYKQ
jgi:replicative DNA helicase